MNLLNFRVEKQAPPSTDWRVYGDILTDDNILIATFGVDGTSLNEWWVRQDEFFQRTIAEQFAVTMAQQIISGDAE
jgi:hypothetical protein